MLDINQNITSVPNRPTPKAKQTRELIIKTAVELFCKNGFEKTTMRDIAAQGNVALGALYYYFKTKDELAAAFYYQLQKEGLARCQQLMGVKKHLSEKIQTVIHYKLEQLTPYRDILINLFKQSQNPKNPLAPFKGESQRIKLQSLGLYKEAIVQAKFKTHKDLASHLPLLLLYYQMGMILFWIYDTSPYQTKTKILLTFSLPLMLNMLKLMRLPLTTALRKNIISLLKDLEE